MIIDYDDCPRLIRPAQIPLDPLLLEWQPICRTDPTTIHLPLQVAPRARQVWFLTAKVCREGYSGGTVSRRRTIRQGVCNAAFSGHCNTMGLVSIVP